MRVSATRIDGLLHLEVRDDGNGGADPAGSGIAASPIGSRRSRGTFAVESLGRRHPGSGVDPVRVVIGEDSVLLREGIARILAERDIDVVGQAGDLPSLLASVNETRPDAVVIDIRMPPTFTDEGLTAVGRSEPSMARRSASSSCRSISTPGSRSGSSPARTAGSAT